MVMGNWEMQNGDPATFSFSLGFVTNPHGDDDRAVPEERLSWGYFSIWAGGENLCAHIEQGENLDAVHWYMLPLMEWFVENWDALLHEERLPLRNAGTSAARSLARTRLPPPSVKELDEFAWLDEWAEWWHRHSLRASSPGGVLPDVYLRRCRDQLEVSTGAEPLFDVPPDVFFVAPNRACYVDPVSASDSVFLVLEAAAQELCRRDPAASRLASLLSRVHGLKDPERRPTRLAWRAGLGGDAERYSEIAREVENVFAAVDPEVRRELEDEGRSSNLIVYGTAYVRLLFGAISPSTTIDDVTRLAGRLTENFVGDVREFLTALDSDELRALERRTRQLTPGEQGSRLGELASKLLAPQSGEQVDIHAVLRRLRVDVSKVDLSDDEVRAVSVFGPTQKPHIFCNRRTRWGQSIEVERFTLAHELCHLLLDREWGGALAVASGPWAPLAIEQRAGAFAAAFLMPSWLLSDGLASLDRPIRDPEAVLALAGRLRVSVSALVDRLYNLGEVTPEDRLRLRMPEGDEPA
jgi:Zn-dependent peptidase ImmA (M78 family)